MRNASFHSGAKTRYQGMAISAVGVLNPQMNHSTSNLPDALLSPPPTSVGVLVDTHCLQSQTQGIVTRYILIVIIRGVERGVWRGDRESLTGPV